jgi:hypothetical protein
MKTQAPTATFSYGSANIAISDESAAALVSSLPEDRECTELMSQLARSPCCMLRAAVAGRADLASETVDLLASDPEPTVVESLLWNASASARLTDAQLRKFISRGSQLACRIAERLGTFSEADETELAQALAEHADPSVRKALAQNAEVPKRVLKSLLKDPDPDVACLAAQMFGSSTSRTSS